MADRSLLTLVLGAGLGTRMKSKKPKVLHHVAGRSMLAHVLALASEIGATDHSVVVGPEMEALGYNLEKWLPEQAKVYVQTDRLGTAHAVLMAKESFDNYQGDVIILYGDTPLIKPDTLKKMHVALQQGADVAVLGFHADNPTGYGRLLVQDGKLVAIREQKDATEAEQAVTFCNSGVFGFRGEVMTSILERIGNENASKEFYLTDAVEIGHADGLKVVAVECPEEEVLGVNSRNQLAIAEQILQRRLREAAMAQGATMMNPDSVSMSYDTVIGQDVIIEPNVFFGPGVIVGDDTIIHASSHLEQTTIGKGVMIGPFARLRPGAQLGDYSKAGNFVEIKKSIIEKGAKINHLTYVGDARVGEGANIGAGVITCNYDGFKKHHTDIGKGAFVGSNSALVAPVKICDGAYIGSGSVITKDVNDDALALTRAEHREIPGWAAKHKARNTKK